MGTGLDTQLGTGVESTYGTPVVVNKFYEIENESLDFNTGITEHSGLRPGLAGYRLGSRRVMTTKSGSGDIVMPVATTGMGRWFNHALGGTATSVQQGATAAYLQTFTPGDLSGKSLTIQKGVVPSISSTAQPFTFHGCKVTDYEFSIAPGGVLMFRVSVDAEDVDTSTALAAASYSTFKPFHFAQGALTVAGSSVAYVSDATVGGTNALSTDRMFLGSGLLKKEPVVNDYRTVSGSLTTEFFDLATFYTRYAADTAVALVLTFTGDLIASTFYETLQITIPEIRFTGETPKASGPDIVTMTVPFEGRSNGTNPAVTISYTTSDVTI